LEGRTQLRYQVTAEAEARAAAATTASTTMLIVGA